MAEASCGRIGTVVFDLGQVVLGWEPERAFDGLLTPDEVRDWFDRISFGAWNRKQDEGRTWATAEAELVDRFPDEKATIRAYRANFDKTLTGYVPGTGAVLAELDRSGVPLVALTNWSAETFPLARERFGLLDRFRGIVVSGEEGLVKPDPALFALLCDRYLLDPTRTLFIDDSPANCEGAASIGMTAVPFTGAADLRAALVEHDLLPAEREPIGPVWHLARRKAWRKAERTGHYPWSTAGVTYERAGFVHLCFEHQLPKIRKRHHRDLDDQDLVLVELDPDRDSLPVVVEQGTKKHSFPHLFRELTPDLAVSVRDWG